MIFHGKLLLVIGASFLFLGVQKQAWAQPGFSSKAAVTLRQP
jgi:hypothetical protein